MPVRLPFSRDPALDVFAVDDRSAQLTYRGPAGVVAVGIGGRIQRVEARTGAAVIDVGDLEPDRSYEVAVSGPDGDAELSFRTRPDLGSASFRFATVSDLHIGAESFGHLPRSYDSSGPYALRCALAAAREAQAWGAELLVIKGDLTEYASVEHWDRAAEFLDGIHVPVLATAGNHDVWKTADRSVSEGFDALGLRHAPVLVDDRPGIRLVVGDTSRLHKGTGSLDQIGPELVEAVRASDRPVWLGIHHNIQRTPVAWFWPPGIPSTDAAPVVRHLAQANPALFISSGHTHRNRSHRLLRDRSVVFTEVSSTSDYPGCWAGYEVTDSGIRQTVRRIADPEAVAWTEYTRRAVGGIWPRWSVGRLDDRCVDLRF